MEDKLNRIEEKLDKVIEKINDTNVILAKNTESLIIHERRTDIAEQKLSLLEREYHEHSAKDDIILQDISKKLEDIDPIKKHVAVVNAIVKYVIPATIAILTFLFKIGILKY